MVSNDAVKALFLQWIVPIFGIILSTILYASPYRTILGQRRSHFPFLEGIESQRLLNAAINSTLTHTAIEVGRSSPIALPIPLNPFPFLCLVQTSLATMLYSIVIQNYFLAIRCVIGFVLSNWSLLSIYSTVLLVHPRRAIYEPMFYSMISVILIGNVVTLLQFSDSNSWLADKISGIIHILNLTIFYASPLSEIISVCKTKDSSIILFSLAITSWLNSMMWGIYGFAVLNNPFVYVPNSFGIIFATIQLILKNLFKEGPKKANGLDESEPREIIEIHSIVTI